MNCSSKQKYDGKIALQETVLIKNYVEFPQEISFKQLFVSLLSLVKHERSQRTPQTCMVDLLSYNFLPSANPEISWKAPNQILSVKTSTSLANGLVLLCCGFFPLNLIPIWLYFLIVKPNILNEAIYYLY